MRRLDVDRIPWDQLSGNLPHVVDSESTAYIMYTSGSTGTPKGVLIPHRAIGRLVLNNGYAAFAADDRVAFAANPSFDASTMEVWGPLLNGGAIVVVAHEASVDPVKFAGVLERQGITVLFVTTALFNQYVASIPLALAGLRVLLCGGEKNDPQAFAELVRTGTGPQHLIHCYGPTETTTFAVTYEVAQVPDATKTIPIGRPIANTRTYIVDAHREPVPIGVVGELYIGGAGVAKGYVNRPELTAEHFIASPFVAGDVLYRTGDLARYLPDGNIEYWGRNDFQVKIRGFRIELGEIEARLRDHASVHDVTVLAREDVPGEKRLVAYYVPNGAGAVSVADLRESLLSVLPEYMVPAAYVCLEALPLTSNGKVDRRALPAPDGSAYAARAYEAPSGEVEQTIARIWSDVLKVQEISRHDDFFELGGHSLLAVRMLSRMRQELHVDLSLTQLFSGSTLRQLGEAVRGTTVSALSTMPRTGRDGPLGLSYAQQRLWFLSQMEGVSEAYHISLGLRLRGQLDRSALHRALDALVSRHESLRTTFAVVDGEPVQRIASTHDGFHLVEHDLRADDQQAETFARLRVQEATAAFDLETGPLIRGRLIALVPSEHVLLVTMHHIISDGWSIGILLNELSALYRGYHENAAVMLRPLDIQYADYAAWQREHVNGAVLQEQLEYWKTTLAGLPDVHGLPTDRPRPPQQDHSAAFVRVDLGPELTGKLRQLSRVHGTTLFTTLLTAWGVLLGRLSGDDDVAIGTPVANRHRTEIEGLIGFFVNTLVLRLDLSGEPSVGDLLDRVKARTLAAQDRQDVPFEQVVEALQPPRSLAHTPLFQLLFAWQNNEGGEVTLPGLEVSALGAGVAVAQFDLTLNLAEAGDSIVGGMTYATALFDRSTVERYVGYLRTLLEAMVADDAQCIARLPMLPAREWHQLVVDWNATEAPYPTDRCIHELFEASAAATPDAVAVEYEDAQLTYGELNARANRLARYLRSLGVAPDTRVALCVEPGLEMVVGLFAVLKAGGAYVPLDPAYPVERLRYMLDDSAPVAVLTHGAVPEPAQEMLRVSGVAIVDLLEDGERWAGDAAGNMDRSALNPEHLAYVIYTSGTIGQPKGVMVAHRNLVASTWARSSMYGHERFLLLSSMAFDSSVAGIFGTLTAGGALVIAPREQISSHALRSLIHTRRITTLLGVPSVLQLIAEDAADGERQGNAVENGRRVGKTSLRQLIAAGETLPPALVHLLHAVEPQAEIYNEYGPTEGTVWATVHRCRSDDETSSVPIGRPISNTRIYIVDGDRAPVPVGVAGELYIGGAGVARGYLSRPELTAERFIASPFVAGDRLYKTGDLARYLPDGTIEYLGRNDFQVKVRGFRIELGEIEARLRDHASVRDAVVLAREDAPGEKRLVAYYTAGEAGEVSAEELRTHLLESLPEYMVPAAYVHLESMPLTPNGKLDRNALPAPDGAAYVVRQYEPPLGAVEEAIARIWSEVLAVERIGRHDNFFELGGHSLLGVRVLSRLRRDLEIKLSLRDVFATPTVRELAQSVGNATDGASPAIVRVDRAGPLAVSYAQQRLWFLSQMQGASEAYHIPLGLRLSGELDRDALVRALNALVSRHEPLRTTFAVMDGDPVQRIGEAESGFALVEHDLRGAADQAEELAKLRLAEATTPFDLAAGPLIRGRLIALSTSEHVFLLTMHHIVSDGWSMGVLYRELSALYRAYRDGAPASLPELAVQYADYAAWQRGLRRNGVARAAWLLAARRWRGYRKCITCRRTVLVRRCKITAGRSCASSSMPS